VASHRRSLGSKLGKIIWDLCWATCQWGSGFLRILQFPLPSILPVAPHSESFGARTIGHLLASVIVDLVPFQPKRKEYI
jgi:hypothetical protein